MILWDKNVTVKKNKMFLKNDNILRFYCDCQLALSFTKFTKFSCSNREEIVKSFKWPYHFIFGKFHLFFLFFR